MVVGQRYAPATIDEVIPGSAAAAAGLEVGDHVLKIADIEVTRFGDMQRVVRENPDVALPMIVRRGHGTRRDHYPEEIVTEDRFATASVRAACAFAASMSQ